MISHPKVHPKLVKLVTLELPLRDYQLLTKHGGVPDTQVNYTNQPVLPALTILFKMLREDGRPLPVGCFTERGVARRVDGLTGVSVDRVTMVTLTDALVEFPPGTLVVTIAQALDQISEWEDHRVWVSVLMGNRQYIMKLCQERAENEEQRKAMEAEVERMHENQLQQQDKLSELIDKVNDQAKMVGEMQQNQTTLQSGSVPRIPQLQGQVPVHSSIASSGSMCPGFLAVSTHPLESMVLPTSIQVFRVIRRRIQRTQIYLSFQGRCQLQRGR